MTVLDDNIALRNSYLEGRGLDHKDFGINYQYPVIPSTNWDWYKTHKFGTGAIYRRAGLFLIYLNVQGEPYLQDEVPYGVLRFLGAPVGVPEGVEPPKVLSQWGRRSEIHFEPLLDGSSWESLPHGSKVIHCESLVKAKAVHKATGLACIGYNGVNGYSSSKQGVELIHEFSGFAFDKMDNIILFDSDVHTNPRVQKARAGLSHKLRHIAHCPMVSWVDLPQRERPGLPPTNWGPDDYLLERGRDALIALLGTAVAYQDEEFSSLVDDLNEKLRWVDGQSMVYARKRRVLMRWPDAITTFRNVNREIVQGKKKTTVYGTDIWLKSVHREEVDNVGYRYMGPEFYYRDGEAIANEYLPAGASPGEKSLDKNGIVYEMLLRLFTEPDLELVRSYLKFLKFTDRKPTSYCVLWSTARGVGKGWLTEFARALIGRRHVATSTADMLAEKYNMHTVNCRLLIAHEFQASNAANKKLALNYLKNYVGDETIPVRAMHRNPYSAEVRAGLIITVNDKSEMPSDGLGDRRQWYIEGGAGARVSGLETWEPSSDEWARVWEALKDDDMMAAASRWVADGADIDFESWKPPMTEARAEDLMEGMPATVQIAYDVLLECRELGVRVLDSKILRSLMLDRMEGQELFVIGRAFGKILKAAGWWTGKGYERATDSKGAAWFTAAPDENKILPVMIPIMVREDALKIVSGKF